MVGVYVDTLTMEQYLALSRENQEPGVVKLEIGGNVNFKIKSQFMRELREDTFSRNKDEDAHDHIDWVISIVGLFNIPGVFKDVAFIQRYCPPSMTAKQLEDIHNFKQEGDESLYQAWERLDAKFEKDLTSTRIVPSTRKLNKLKRPDIQNLDELRLLMGTMEEIIVDLETSGLNKLHGVSFISRPESDTPEVLQDQLTPKELNPGSFTLPCTIGKFNFYAMDDLGASINVIPRSIFEHLRLTNLKKTNMLCEMADMSKKAPLGIVKNVLVKIDKFLFPCDFVIIYNTPSETTILGRPFLATIHEEIDVFAGKISLGINENRISFDTIRKDHNYTNPGEKKIMVRPQSPTQSNNQIDYDES
ncbi:putative reverse transcriptase domain-containing protein, partial [Tanacetum coccineum]